MRYISIPASTCSGRTRNIKLNTGDDMATAQELRDKLKPLPIEEGLYHPSKHRTENAWVNLLALMKEAAEANNGSINVFLSSVLDNYSMVEKGNNYSAEVIISRLLEPKNGYTLNVIEDIADGQCVNICWEPNYRTYTNMGNPFYLKDT